MRTRNILRCIHESQMKAIIRAVSAFQILLLKRSQAGRKDPTRFFTRRLPSRDRSETGAAKGLLLCHLVFNTGLGMLCDFPLTTSTEELKRRFHWITWQLPALHRKLLSVHLSVPCFAEPMRTTHRQPTPKAPPSEPVLTAGDGALAMLYTAAPLRNSGGRCSIAL